MKMFFGRLLIHAYPMAWKVDAAVLPRATGGLEILNYAAGRRVYLKGLFSE
jgi:hypothetical protein